MNRQKGSRTLRKEANVRKYLRKKRKPINPQTVEAEKSSFSTSAKKIKMQEEILVPEDPCVEYRILNFVTVFAAISNYVKCKDCGGEVRFQTANTRGLGFRIVVTCDQCLPRSIPSCSFIGHTYEINRRFIFCMRLLGHGLNGCKKFCGLMDMPQFLYKSTYNVIADNILDCVKGVSDKLFKKAVNEEKAKVPQGTNELTVSGDGTWQKRGFTSLYGVSSIIGYFTGKVLDIEIKSAFCKMCEYWEKKQETVEYQEWSANHSEECTANHTGSAGKMESDAMIEMFKRSIKKYNVKYINYIGDGDSKTYSGIINSAPYGDTSIIKKECIGHVQKRMGSRLRACKQKNKGLGGKGKLTGKLIDKLTTYYGLAIRRNCDSVEKMRNAIWATYEHYRYNHDKCPVGRESWCSWQKASANDELDDYEHDYHALSEDVLSAIRPIYEDLSKEDLLKRCIGGFNQNNNESYNQLIWKITPKSTSCGPKAVHLAAHIAATTFNEGFRSILQIFEAMGVHCGGNAHHYVEKQDAERIKVAELRTEERTREARILRRQRQVDILEATTSGESSSYGPGIDDSV